MLPDELPEELKKTREILEAAEWVDGKVTAGYQSAKAKDNRQIPENHPAARQVGGDDFSLTALGKNPLFRSGRSSAAGFPAALQPVRRRPILRQPRG